MFLDAVLHRNPELVAFAAELHDSGAIPPDTYVMDLDAIESNAELLAREADRLGLSLWFVVKQIGRNPELIEAIARHIPRFAAIDPPEARILHAAGAQAGNLGHLVQIPSRALPEMLAWRPETVTVYDLANARAVSETATRLGFVQDVLIRLEGTAGAVYPGQEGGVRLGRAADGPERTDGRSGADVPDCADDLGESRAPDGAEGRCGSARGQTRGQSGPGSPGGPVDDRTGQDGTDGPEGADGPSGADGGPEGPDGLDAFVAEVERMPGVRVAGVTAFPCVLCDPDTGEPRPTANFALARAAVERLAARGYTDLKLSAPSATSMATLPLLARLGATHGEPGHALTGTTPLHAVDHAQPEQPAYVYVSEVAHTLADGRPALYGGGFYARGGAREALIPRTGARLRVEDAPAANIDYYRLLAPGDARVGDTAVLAFRTQIFVTRSSVAVVSGLSLGAPKLSGLYDPFGRPH
ncbi:alanine racemase [Streptomyces purpurogeneiscleroticus]|uniref:alanine racemase n=1 Tax=Streptomyces purpurogeneiscleroticus TaxID=68259 RepID=UPI001CBFF59D|nr:alanine racemase [Streptomyces purpurogeneiscleroticus]